MTTYDDNYDEVLGVLVHMFTKAATMSPAHSKRSSHQKESSGDSAKTLLSVNEGLRPVDENLEDLEMVMAGEDLEMAD